MTERPPHSESHAGPREKAELRQRAPRGHGEGRRGADDPVWGLAISQGMGHREG